MKKIGFIGEGESEVIILNSANFKDILSHYNIECVGAFNAEGIENLKNCNKRISSYFEIFKDRNAERVYILADLDNLNCIVEMKNSLYNYDQMQIIIIAVKAIEAWYLADSITLSKIFRRNYYYPEPEKTVLLPFDTIHNEFLQNLDRGFGKTKVSLSITMVKNGFSIQNAIKHENCKSVKYFFKKLTL